MTMCRLRFPAAALLLSGFALCSATVPAFATTYTTYITSNDNEGNILNQGLTSSGSVVLLNSSGTSYTEFTPPNSYLDLGTDPSKLPTFDNGSACTPTNTGSLTDVQRGVCNGGREVFQARASGSDDYGLYLGENGMTDLLYGPGHYSFDSIVLNGAGDVAAVVAGGGPDPGTDRNVLLIASTPEPSSLVLLATGLAGAAGIVRRRLGGWA